MKKTLRIDPHVHSRGISQCSKVDYKTIAEEKKKFGYDGAILANHCQAWYYPAEEHANYIERVIEEYRRAKEYGDEHGFRFYLGLEVSIDRPHYSDWLLYGVTEAFLRKTPCLYQCSQEELFKLCEENGVLLVQAHPFRQTPGYPQYMHGVEINCTPGDMEKADLVQAYAKEHGLLVTCGTDYHFAERTYRGGIIIPEKCENAVDVAAYIRKNRGVTFFIEDEETPFFVEK